MGMYLDIYRLVEKTKCPRFEESGWFFYVGKYVDDEKFATEYSGENEYVQCEVPYCCGMSYWRPKKCSMLLTGLKKT